MHMQWIEIAAAGFAAIAIVSRCLCVVLINQREP